MPVMKMDNGRMETLPKGRACGPVWQERCIGNAQVVWCPLARLPLFPRPVTRFGYDDEAIFRAIFGARFWEKWSLMKVKNGAFQVHTAQDSNKFFRPYMSANQALFDKLRKKVEKKFRSIGKVCIFAASK